MPGGIGPIDERTADACRAKGPAADPIADWDESEVFYRLTIGRVCYSPSREVLYFVESPRAPVAGLVGTILRGLGQAPVFGQLHLDTHSVFAAARTVHLRRSHAVPVLVAMRLRGLQVMTVR